MRSSVPRPSHTESGFFEDAAGLGFGAWRVFVGFGRLWYFFGKCIGQKEREGHDGWMDGVHELVGILPCPAPPPPLPHVLELEDCEAIVLQRLCCQTCRARRLGQDASAPARGFFPLSLLFLTNRPFFSTCLEEVVSHKQRRRRYGQLQT